MALTQLLKHDITGFGYLNVLVLFVELDFNSLKYIQIDCMKRKKKQSKKREKRVKRHVFSADAWHTENGIKTWRIHGIHSDYHTLKHIKVFSKWE